MRLDSLYTYIVAGLEFLETYICAQGDHHEYKTILTVLIDNLQLYTRM